MENFNITADSTAENSQVSARQDHQSSTEESGTSINFPATRAFLSALSTQRGLLSDGLGRSLNSLSNNLTDYVQNPGKADNPAYDGASARTKAYMKLSSLLIARDPELQEKIAQNLSTSSKLVRSRDAVNALSASMDQLPKALSEGTSAGQSLSRFICESLVNLTDHGNMGAGLERDLAVKGIYVPDKQLSSRSLQATDKVLSMSIAYVKGNDPKILAKLASAPAAARAGTGGTQASTPQVMTTYLKQALNEFPEDSTYLDIFKQNRAHKQEGEADQMSKETAARIHRLISRAAQTAREGNLLPGQKGAANRTPAAETPRAAERSFSSAPRPAASDSRSGGAQENVRELSLSELSARAARLQQQFRQDRQKLAQEGRLPNPAAMPARSGTAAPHTLQARTAAGTAVPGSGTSGLNQAPGRSHAATAGSSAAAPGTAAAAGSTISARSSTPAPGNFAPAASRAAGSGTPAAPQAPGTPAPAATPASGQPAISLDMLSSSAPVVRMSYSAVPNSYFGTLDAVPGMTIPVSGFDTERVADNAQMQALTTPRSMTDVIREQQRFMQQQNPRAAARSADGNARGDAPAARSTAPGQAAQTRAAPGSAAARSAAVAPAAPNSGTAAPAARNPAAAAPGQNAAAAQGRAAAAGMNAQAAAQPAQTAPANAQAATARSDARQSAGAALNAAAARPAAPAAAAAGPAASGMPATAPATAAAPASTAAAAAAAATPGPQTPAAAGTAPALQPSAAEAAAGTTAAQTLNQAAAQAAAASAAATDTAAALNPAAASAAPAQENVATAQPAPADARSGAAGPASQQQMAASPELQAYAHSREAAARAGNAAANPDLSMNPAEGSNRTLFAPASGDRTAAAELAGTSGSGPAGRASAMMQATVPMHELDDSYTPADAQKAGVRTRGAAVNEGKLAGAMAPLHEKSPELNGGRQPLTTPGAAAITNGQDAPLPDPSVVEDVRPMKENTLFQRLASLFTVRKEPEMPLPADNVQNNPAAVQIPSALRGSPLDQLFSALNYVIARGNLPPPVSEQAKKFIRALENPVADLREVNNWLNFITGPLSPSSPQALALHQWAFLLLCLRFRELGKSASKFLKGVRGAENLDAEIEDLLKGEETSPEETSELLEEVLSQADRLRHLAENTGGQPLPRYIPLPPCYEGGREGGFSASQEDDQMGGKCWHLYFMFDLRNLGAVEIRAVALLPEIRIAVVTETLAGLQQVQRCLPELEEQLARAGLDPQKSSARLGRIDVHQAGPAPFSRPRPPDGATFSVDV